MRSLLSLYHNWKSFLLKALGAAVSPALYSGSLFVRLKVIALVGGAQGIGLLSLVQAHQNVFTGLASLSAGNAYTRDIAKDNGEVSSSSPVRLCIFMGLSLGGLLSVCAGVLWILTNDEIHHSLLLVFAIFLGVFSSANLNQVTYALRGLSRISSIVRISALNLLLSSLFLLILFFSGLTDVWIFFLAIPLATLITLILVPDVRSLYPRKILSVSLLSLFQYLKKNNISALFWSALFVTVSQLSYRWIINEDFGIASLGYFQTAWMFSSLVMMVNTSVMSSVYLPIISNENNLESKIIFFHVTRQILLNLVILTSAFVGFYFCAEFLIIFFASAELLPAIGLVFALFSVDALRCIVSPLGYYAFSKGDVVGFVGIDIVGAILSLLILLWVSDLSLLWSVIWSQGVAAVVALLFICYRIQHCRVPGDS